MKTLYRFAIASCLVLSLGSCAKEKEEVTPPASAASFTFLKEGFVCTYGEYINPDSTNLGFESITKMTISKIGNNWVATEEITDPNTNEVVDGDQIEIKQLGNLLLLDGEVPVNILNPVLNQTYIAGEYSIKCTQQNVSITTQKGTFSCNRFELYEDGDLSYIVYGDKNYVYPYVKLGETYNGSEQFFLELINNK